MNNFFDNAINSFDQPRDYPDEFWYAAYQFAFNLHGGNKKILGLHSFGDPRIHCFQNYSADVSYSCIILHKDFFNKIPISVCEDITSYDLVYENPVFCILKRSQKNSNEILQDAIEPIANRLSNMCGKRICFLHIPKTAGTSINHQLMQNFTCLMDTNAATIKHTTTKEFKSFVGHIRYSDIKDYQFDAIVSVLRHPIERFISSVKHSRRPEETNLGPNMQRMRNTKLYDFMKMPQATSEIHALTNYLCSNLNEALKARHNDAKKNLVEKKIMAWDITDLKPLKTFFQAQFKVKMDIETRLNVNAKGENYFDASEVDFINDGLNEYFIDAIRHYNDYLDIVYQDKKPIS